jgi:hypothetical protein
MFRFRRNVTVIAIETANRCDSFDGPIYRKTYIQRYTLDVAVTAHERERYLNLIIRRMGVGRVTVRHIQHASA